MADEEKGKNRVGRPSGKSRKLKGVLLPPGDFAVLLHIGEQTGEPPERVARGIIRAALWRSPESLITEIVRVALEKGAEIAASQPPEEQAEEEEEEEG